jgi:hypothetical protein
MFLFQKKNRIKIEVCEWHDGFRASAYDGKCSIHSCFGTTPEAAEEMARLKLKQFQEDKTQRKIDFDFTKK